MLGLAVVVWREAVVAENLIFAVWPGMLFGRRMKVECLVELD